MGLYLSYIGGTELDDTLWVGSHENEVEGENDL